jgi:ribonucleoside-diphosphate reductase alpha chain
VSYSGLFSSITNAESLNIMINPQTPTKEINALYIQAWKLGIKTLYYQHSTSAAQKFSQSKLCTYACEA